MATTSNYGWTIPDDTDLVKNGALAIRTLGNAIDTTAAASFGGGLVHINTTSFSAVASQSINDVFTSTYDNYLVIFYSKGSTNLSTQFRMRASGSDDSGSVYDNARVYNVTSTATAVDDQNQTNAILGSTSTLPNQFATLNLMNPNVALETAINIEVSNWSASAQRAHHQTTLVQTATQYDGFSIIASTGNITGSISIYGYAKA